MSVTIFILNVFIAQYSRNITTYKTDGSYGVNVNCSGKEDDLSECAIIKASLCRNSVGLKCGKLHSFSIACDGSFMNYVFFC